MKRLVIKITILIAVVTSAVIWRLAVISENPPAQPTAARVEPAAILIIDPGHGGADGGASSAVGLRESEVNLDIARRLDQLMGFFGVPTVMTRESEEIEYSQEADTIRKKKNEDMRNRVKLINSIENGVLISIHQNTYPDPEPSGAQVLFARTRDSEEFAKNMQSLLISVLNPYSRRAAAPIPGRVFMMNNITVPAILIECAFLSNPDEERLLQTDEYRLKIAAVIAAGYLGNREMLYTYRRNE